MKTKQLIIQVQKKFFRINKGKYNISLSELSQIRNKLLNIYKNLDLKNN